MHRLLFLASALLATSAPAQEVGRLPFATIDGVLQRADGIDRSKVAVRVRVTSKDAAVKPGSISLTLESKAAGTLPVPVDADGRVGDFPRTAELRKENPFLVSNQPKGSLSLTMDAGIPIPSGQSFPYATLVGGLAELNAALKKQAGVLGVLMGSAKRVLFVFPDSLATLTINAKAAPIVLKSDRAGEIAFALDPALTKENPTVTVSVRPRWIGIAK